MSGDEDVKAEVKLRQIVGEVDDLPTLPSVVTKLVTLVEDPESSARDLNAVITQDPSLTAKVLKLVNSAFYGFSREISTVSEAVVILGFDAIKSLALSASVFDIFDGKGVEGFDRVGLWKHSVATGIGAELVASWDRYPNPEEVMVTGILHNVGKLLLELHAPEKMIEVLNLVEEKGCQFYEAEVEVLGIGHPEIGAKLTEEWNLPQEVVNGIRYYRKPLQAPEKYRRLALFIHAGDVFARTKNVGWPGDNQQSEFREEVWDSLDMTNETTEMLLDKMEKNLDKADEFIKLAVETERS